MTFDPAQRAYENAMGLVSKGYLEKDMVTVVEAIGKSVQARHRLQQVASCNYCPSMNHCGRKAMGFGNFASSVMIVGEKTSEEDSALGQAMTISAEGLVLTRILNLMNVNRQMVYITNLLKCWTSHDRPLQDEADQCAAHLAQEEAIVKPAVIIAMGQLTAATLFGDSALPAGRGHWGKFGDTPVLATHDLGYIHSLSEDRASQAKNELWTDFNYAFAAAQQARPDSHFHLDANRPYSWTPLLEQKAG